MVAPRNPLRLVGGQLFSGAPATGEQQHVRGGALAATVWSGGALNGPINSGSRAPVLAVSGDNAVFWSGRGRLNSVFPIGAAVNALSGILIQFFDAVSGNVAASGISPAQKSGLTVLFELNRPGGAVSGLTANFSGYQSQLGIIYNVDMPFTGGLGVSMPSGSMGVSFSWTPEVVTTF